MGLDLSPRSTGLVVARGTPGVHAHPDVLRHRTLRTQALGDSLKTAVSGLLPSGNFRGDNEECIEWTSNRILKAFRKFEPDLVMIESYAYVKNPGVFSFICEQGGVVRNKLHRAGAIFLVRKPTVFKEFATGGGGASKQEMIVKAKAEGFKGATNSDVADAYWIARFGIERYDEMLEVVESGAESESA